MKFKMQDKQNQLIEGISDKHLVVGVDIAQQFQMIKAFAFVEQRLFLTSFFYYILVLFNSFSYSLTNL